MDLISAFKVSFVFLLQALGLKRDDTFSVTMLGHCIEMYIGDVDAYTGMIMGAVVFMFEKNMCLVVVFEGRLKG